LGSTTRTALKSWAKNAVRQQKESEGVGPADCSRLVRGKGQENKKQRGSGGRKPPGSRQHEGKKEKSLKGNSLPKKGDGGREKGPLPKRENTEPLTVTWGDQEKSEVNPNDSKAAVRVTSRAKPGERN